MKQNIYEWHDKLKFGKYEGRHLDEAFQEDPEYIQKCLEDMDDFHITINTRRHLEDLIKDFKFSDKALRSVVNQKNTVANPGSQNSNSTPPVIHSFNHLMT